LYFDTEAEQLHYDLNASQPLSMEELREVRRMSRKGEIDSELREDHIQAIEAIREVAKLAVILFHVFVSLGLLVGVTVVAAFLNPNVSIDMLSLFVVVGSMFYSAVLLNLRFGLRKKVQRAAQMMAIEPILCIILTHLALLNAGFVNPGSIGVIVPFIIYLLTVPGSRLSQWLFERLLSYFVDSSGEFKRVARELAHGDD
jgi:hypothetical protein